MNIRPLTVTEKSLIKLSKNTANAALKQKRQVIKCQIAQLHKENKATKPSLYLHGRIRQLEQELLKYRNIKGYPVRVKTDDCSIVIDYSFLRGIDKKLPSRSWFKWIVVEEDRVIVEYLNQHTKTGGRLELYDFPKHKKELLTNLPVVDITAE
ncbi:hypothetical protein [Caldibacillus debilis]|uniref:Uncharacterized protein n=1 Tax=Caldibacillus debilis GB1 TaxID=1339248 RepID=A0A420VHW2_9BACI|nr:hypothetical protein [Caldibacillus debilis]RKO63241.1 hypothetical protein Cdeb_00333 [Caldibacillus debilis GB1]